MFKWFRNSIPHASTAAQPDAGQNPGKESLVAVVESDSCKTQGNELFGQGKLAEAAQCYRRALALNPANAEACSNLGYVFQTQGDLVAASRQYRMAIAINPHLLAAQQNLASILPELDQAEDAVETLQQVIRLSPEAGPDVYSSLLYSQCFMQMPASARFEQARQFGRLFAGMVSQPFTSWTCADQPTRLRVGLVSGDLRIHSVGYFMQGLLASIDPGRIELIAYPTNDRTDEMTERLRTSFADWRPLSGKNDAEAAKLIHDDGVHILVDLSGHTSHNRLPMFAWKPSPVQVTWLGLPATTGLDAIDYILADAHAIPEGCEDQFTERVWRLPDTYVCMAEPAAGLKVSPLPARASGRVTFGSFNNLMKMNDDVVAAWSRLLKSVPASHLLLKAKQFIFPSIQERTLQRFASCGITPDRLQLVQPLASVPEHLKLYNSVDIALDPFPYPGVTTSVEALWMGVPVLSLQGDTFLSRSAASIACNAGLADWVAADTERYVQKAAGFAADLEYLAGLRAGLRQQVLSSPLYDTHRFARNFEQALWSMWQKHSG